MGGVETPAIPHVTVRRNTNAYKAGRTQLIGSSQLPFSKGVEVHANSTANCLKSLAERVLGGFHEGVFIRTPHPKEIVDEHMSAVRTGVLRHIGTFQPKMTHQAYARALVGSKRAVAERAALSLMERALADNDANLSSFVKKEKSKPGSLPRLIQPRGARFNVSLGSWLRPVEHRIYRAFEKSRGYTVVHKHLNPEQRAHVFKDNFDAFDNPVMIGLDASRFDKHVSPAALKFEASFYTGIYGNDPELVRLLNMQRRNKGFINTEDGDTIEYEVVGSRMSGDVNTSLGNVIIMTTLVLAYADMLSIKIRLANDGDDCVVFLEQCDLERFSFGLAAWFLEKGFPLTIEKPVYSLEEVEFCQCNPMYIGGRWLMVRNVKKCLQHDTLYVGVERDYEAVMSATGLCGLSLYGDVPVLGVFYRALARLSPNGQKVLDKHRLQNGLGWNYNLGGMQKREFNPTDEDRFSFYCASGIQPAEQLEFEAFYSKLDYHVDAPLRREDINQYRQTAHSLSNLFPLL